MDAEKTKELISANLQYYMKINNINNRELAEKLGVSESTVGKWILKKSVPRMKIIEMISTLFNINKSDLIEDKTKIDTDAKKDNLKEAEQELIDNYNKSSKEGKKIILDTSRNISKSYPIITRQQMIDYLKEFRIAAYKGAKNIHTLSNDELEALYYRVKEDFEDEWQNNW